jgi:NAD-dependent dihydropyrimidine dehydrogenase PreA subunit
VRSSDPLCGLSEGSSETGSELLEERYLRNVVSLDLDQDKCTGCGVCETVCPHGVLEVVEKAVIVDRDACIECGACALNCPAEAVQVEAGVGCATAILIGAVKGTEPTCGCCGDSGESCE